MRRVGWKILSSDTDRLISKLKESESGCWEYQGARTYGYGSFWYKGKNYRAHRVAYELYTGDFPDGVILHTCDNPCCCNPLHLCLGTQSLNMADMARKQRSLKGLKNPSSKFTEDDIINIRESKLKVKDLAIKYNVARQTITRVRKGHSYK